MPSFVTMTVPKKTGMRMPQTGVNAAYLMTLVGNGGSTDDWWLRNPAIGVPDGHFRSAESPWHTPRYFILLHPGGNMTKNEPPSGGFKKFRSLLFQTVETGSLFNNEPSWKDQKKKWNDPPLGSVLKDSDIEVSTFLQGDRVYVGGVSGGSCWDTGEGDPHYNTFVDDAESPELPSLDKLLEVVCPAITFLQYKRLVSLAKVETHGESENEYYGNCSNYVRKRVKVGSLYDALCEMNLLTPERGGA